MEIPNSVEEPLVKYFSKYGAMHSYDTDEDYDSVASSGIYRALIQNFRHDDPEMHGPRDTVACLKIIGKSKRFVDEDDEVTYVHKAHLRHRDPFQIETWAKPANAHNAYELHPWTNWIALCIVCIYFAMPIVVAILLIPIQY